MNPAGSLDIGLERLLQMSREANRLGQCGPQRRLDTAVVGPGNKRQSLARPQHVIVR